MVVEILTKEQFLDLFFDGESEDLWLAYSILGKEMAEPKLQIEQRLDKIEEYLGRLEFAISMMGQWLVQAQTGFGYSDAEGIEKILRGERTKEEPKSDDSGESGDDNSNSE